MLAVKTGSKRMTKAYSKISGYNRPHVYVFVSDKKKFHSGERFQKFPDTAGKYTGYVWTQAVFVKKNLRFHKFPDTCGRRLCWKTNCYVTEGFCFHSALIHWLVHGHMYSCTRAEIPIIYTEHPRSVPVIRPFPVKAVRLVRLLSN